jgi:hypothetical protein
MSEIDHKTAKKKWLASPNFNPARCNVVVAEHRENRTTADEPFAARGQDRQWPSRLWPADFGRNLRRQCWANAGTRALRAGEGLKTRDL